MKRISHFLPVLLMVFASSVHAGEKPDPCALQWSEAAALKYNTPEFDAANKIWKECVALASEQQKMEFAASRETWAASLDKLPTGGWVFLMVSQDGIFTTFGSHRHATREGSVVSLWLRYEYRESRSLTGGANYKSVVYREMYDCSGVRSKSVSNTFYSESNLAVLGPSYTYDEAKVAWAPVIPGTLGDSLLDWACKTTPPRAQPAKAALAK
jgi:surface-adhesin protein E